MNILIDKLPNSVFVNNKEYEINSDFRVSMLFELLMQDDEVKDKDKIDMAIELFYTHIPEDIEKAIDKLLWFYRCGKDTEHNSSRCVGSSSSKVNNIYSFEHDDDYIYAAFLSQYGIDLQDTDLHWWKFKSMFKSLNENNEIVKIMGYRSMKIDSDMSSKEKDFYNKMKKLYALPKSKSEKDKINAIEEALLNGTYSGD